MAFNRNPPPLVLTSRERVRPPRHTHITPRPALGDRRYTEANYGVYVVFGPELPSSHLSITYSCVSPGACLRAFRSASEDKFSRKRNAAWRNGGLSPR